MKLLNKILLFVLITAILTFSGFYLGKTVGGKIFKFDESQIVLANENGFELRDKGFKTPESILYLPDADHYLVSNINGSPLEEDDNGFISTVSPTGSIFELKWINGEDENVRLDAPKGMAVKYDILYVTDIKVVRKFHKHGGEVKGEIKIPGATFLNDICLGPDGYLYVSDTGTKPDKSDGAVWKIISDEEVVKVVEEGKAVRPNGLTTWDGDLILLPFAAKTPYHVFPDGNLKVINTAPFGGLDGCVELADKRLAFSSWEGSAIYTLDLEFKLDTLYTDLKSPADIGYDSKRDLLLVPLFQEDAVISLPANSKIISDTQEN